MAYSQLLVDRPAEHVLRVCLNRPESANALSSRLLDELTEVVEGIAGDEWVHAWILTGAPRPDGRPWFSAGVDMKEALAGTTSTERGDRLCRLIADLLVPSIAQIDGTCTTGALELVLACHLRIASTTAEISDWHLRRTGLGIGAWGMAARLTRLVGEAKATELILTGRVVSGTEAEAVGLVNRAVPHEDLERVTLEMAAQIAAMPRRGVRMTMGFLTTQQDMSLQDSLHWASQVPGFMGVRLRPFKDAAQRFLGSQEAES